MRIAAVADVHSPRFLNEFTSSLTQCRKPDLFLFAGDIVNRGKADEYLRVVDAIDRIHGEVPIIACFGNEEYLESRVEIISQIRNRVAFLDETAIRVSITGSTIGVVGSSVILDQSIEQSRIRNFFENRADRISQLLQDVAKNTEHTILLLHYSPFVKNHDETHSFSWWVSKAVETKKPSLIVHGHIHDSTNPKVVIETTPVYNVALPAVGSITELTL